MKCFCLLIGAMILLAMDSFSKYNNKDLLEICYKKYEGCLSKIEKRSYKKHSDCIDKYMRCVFKRSIKKESNWNVWNKHTKGYFLYAGKPGDKTGVKKIRGINETQAG